MDLKAMTIATYNKSADYFAKRYLSFPTRTAHIERALELLGPREHLCALEPFLTCP